MEVSADKTSIKELKECYFCGLIMNIDLVWGSYLKQEFLRFFLRNTKFGT
jgi:hypothetical protein